MCQVGYAMDKVTLTNTRDGAYEFTVLAGSTELS